MTDTVRIKPYPNGFAVIVGRHRWDYWAPTKWWPLSVRRVGLRWWGAVTYSPNLPPLERNGHPESR